MWNNSICYPWPPLEHTCMAPLTRLGTDGRHRGNIHRELLLKFKRAELDGMVVAMGSVALV